MIFRKTFGWAALLAGCTFGFTVAVMAFARDDQYGNESRPQLQTKQYEQSQPTDDEQNFSDETSQRRSADRQHARQAETKAIELQGHGRQASKKFNLQRGLCILKVENDGDTNFIVRLLDDNGKEIDTPVNQIGPFVGETSLFVDRPMQALLDVETDGQWRATLTQPTPEVGQSTPTTLEGNGHKTTPFIQLDKGLVVFKLNHNGEGRFKVRLADRDGRTVTHLVNTLGQFEGSKPVSIENPGIYFLNISADGDWTVSAE
ncbi:MAG: hypothetical protein IT427_06945 [Pirellulales bacterium]|nr:hypothetical protein [Pirellulales bacterium]